MMKRMMALVLAGTLAGAAPAIADTVKLVTGNGYKPFTDESLPNGGMFTELVVAAYENAGHEVETVDFLPWKRGEKLTAEGKYTGTFPLVTTEERNKKFIYSDPVYTAASTPIVANEDAGSINSFDDLKGKTYCYPLGWNATVTIRQMIEDGDVERVSPRDFTSCFKMIKAGRVDLTELERPSIPWELHSALGSADALHAENFVTEEVPLYLVFDKDGEDAEHQRDTFNAALKKLKQSGHYDQIVEKHLTQRPE